MRAAAQGAGTCEVDIVGGDADRPAVVELTLRSTWSDAGRLTGFQATLADVTDRRRADSQRANLERERRARAEADAANHMKDEFLGIVSHELRTPLNAMLGWMEILAARGAEPDVLERGLAIMRRNGQALARLVDDILDVSRIVSGKLQVDRAPLAADDVVRSAVDQARPAAQAKRIQLTHAIASGCDVWGDRVRFQQVVSNLLSNAIKFTGQGGNVDVTLERSEAAIVLLVRDDGCGIAAEDLPHIFERFRQGDSSTTRAHSGLGLGLAIARHIVEAHGGAIEGSSAGPGRGARFIVTLPAYTREDGAAPSTRAAGPGLPHGEPSLAGVKILCVDDEPDGLELVTLMLSALGAVVRTANAVEEALALVPTFHPDAVISDLAMPAADGYDFVDRLRRLPPPWRDTPVVALTAYARREDAARAVRSGFDDHLGKPVEGVALLRVLTRLLRRR